MYASFREFFQTATGHPPYEWQGRLANGEGYAENDPRTHAGSDCESRLIAIATGLGKTAGVILAWIWNQSRGDLQIAATHSGSSTPWPRRLSLAWNITRTLANFPSTHDKNHDSSHIR